VPGVDHAFGEATIELFLSVVSVASPLDGETGVKGSAAASA